jgi:hypothetical protein
MSYFPNDYFGNSYFTVGYFTKLKARGLSAAKRVLMFFDIM